MEFLRKHKRLFLAFGIVICFTAIIITVTGVAPTSFLGRAFGYVVTPMQRGTSSASTWISGRIAVLAQSEQILAENRALQEENARLRAENARLHLLDEESIHLHSLFNMRQRYPQLPMEGARIIGQNPNDWQSRFTIDKGANHGITTNMIVLGEDGGVLGRIGQVGANHSQVITIMDSSFASAARNTRTEDVGTVQGNLELANDGLIRMDHILATARFMEGDEIITSAHGAFFPPGLSIGTVVSVHGIPGGLAQYAIIQPTASLGRIDFVLIVTQLFEDAPDPDIINLD